MSGRGTTNWQTSLADLSLILFMVTAAAMGRQVPNRPAALPQSARSPSPALSQPSQMPSTAPVPSVAPVASDIAQAGQVARGEPMAIWVRAAGAPPLTTWLAQQAPDPRQRLTLAASYGPAPGARAQALSEALQLADQARAAGFAARIVLDPASTTSDTRQRPSPVRAVLAYDNDPMP